jgi:hypothetical protein
MKKIAMIVAAALALTACEDDAKVASRNLSKAADNFEIGRRVVFYNGITDRYMLEITGLCSLDSGASARSITVTCKTKDGFKKHLLGLSDNVTYFVEQLGSANVSVDMYRVTFKPSTIIPDVDLRGGLTANPVPAQK